MPCLCLYILLVRLFLFFFFHLGVENGWFYYESVCTFSDAKFSTFAEYRAFIESADLVLCDTRSPLFLGATAAAYNFLYNLFCIFVVYFKFQIKKNALIFIILHWYHKVWHHIMQGDLYV